MIVRDRRSILTSILLALFLFPAIFIGLGAIEQEQNNRAENTTFTIGVTENAQGSDFVNALEAREDINVVLSSSLIAEIESGAIAGLIETSTNDLQQEVVTYVYDEASNNSISSLTKMNRIFEAYIAEVRAAQLEILNIQEVDIQPAAFAIDTVQSRTDNEATSGLLLFFLPYIILLGLVQGSVQYAIEMTAGEKDRDTLATTMSLQARPSQIALAKIFATLALSLTYLILQVVSIYIAFTYFPIEGADTSSLGVTQVWQIAVVMLPFSLLMTSLMVMVGIIARNQKEGNIYALPFTFGSILVAFAGNLFDANTPLYIFSIPLIGHIAMLRQIVLGEFFVENMLVLNGVTLVAFGLVVFVTARLFSRESVLFRK